MVTDSIRYEKSTNLYLFSSWSGNIQTQTQFIMNHEYLAKKNSFHFPAKFYVKEVDSLVYMKERKHSTNKLFVRV